MAYANPTALKIGMSGELAGEAFTVLGRVVYGVVEDGTTYTWNEFYLGSERGTAVTLVFEEMEQGPTWKLFRELEHPPAWTPAQAAKMTVGETLPIAGHEPKITRVDISRVLRIDGDAPADTAVGDLDHYFNAETDFEMFVASWKADQVEFFRGHNLPGGTVERVFGLKTSARLAAALRRRIAQPASLARLIPFAVFLLIGGFVLFPAFRRDEPTLPPPAKLAAPARLLRNGATGHLRDHAYQVSGHALVQIGQQGRTFDRNEYLLSESGGPPALLVDRGSPESPAWQLLVPVEGPLGLTPLGAAALHSGDLLASDSRGLRPVRLFETWVETEDGATDIWPAHALYGFYATSSQGTLLLRWDDRQLQSYRAETISEEQVRDAFGVTH